jgi:hypothetical protein
MNTDGTDGTDGTDFINSKGFYLNFLIRVNQCYLW